MNIPNLPVGEIVDENRNPTDSELTFRQNLVSELQSKAGEEGLVVPSQSAANITTIVANQLPDLSYTCLAGTLLYDTTSVDPALALKVVVLVAGVPTLKTVVLV